jgi:8-oxo-dGTP diphosphatase
MTETHTLLVVAGLLEQDGRWLVTCRPSGDWMEGYWEFPGGKVQPGEDPRHALQRELQEELAIQVNVDQIIEVVFHRYPDRAVIILFFRCRHSGGNLHSCLGQEWGWFTPEEMRAMPFLPADIPLIERLQAGLPS